MPRLQATVPQGAPANALLRVRLPDGQEVKVRVPEGLKPGDEFQFEVSSIGEIKSSVARKGNGVHSNIGGGGEKIKHASSSSKNPKKKRSNHSDASSARGNVNHQRTPLFISLCLELYQKIYEALTREHDIPSSTTHTNKTHQTPQPVNTSDYRLDIIRRGKKSTLTCLGFLDRDIVNGRDFCTALAVGMFIGLSIVLGFLAGVLWVTPVQ
ncbi:hypothetical protein HJC23_011475 [Cyclotella cryptica]|uniref:Uncharacterized protein n=1 Tax=Cyclotella cryptica TaxID=29204 RepID=A0ABD3NUF0_9STRA|eukprot:CCRYP_019873-RA/>CCRYP_019873-RA protein AED:0.22 eAED:0.22 QI:0/-1/0/1/-1/1/1/0/210